jgi:thiosulfate/3-mercaptopyruvate sulfurtransferase
VTAYGEAVIEPFVSWSWLVEHREDVVLVDVRRDLPGLPGAVAFERGHLPGAAFVDLERCLAGPPSPQEGRHPLPTPEVFAEGMAQAGIGDEDTVVAYDDASGVVAARLVWMLRATGHEAALLDGALGDGGVVLDEAPPPSRPRATFTPRPWPPVAGIHDAVDPAHVVVDARPRARYLGAPDPLDPRPGHLPGARSVPCLENVDERGHLLADGVLRDRLEQAGVSAGATVVSTCGSGVTACHTLLVMERLGLGHGLLYPGSWSQYASDPDRPVELGDPA